MHQCSTNIHVELKLWQNIPEWCVAKLDENLFAARIGYAVTEPKIKVIYEDDNVKLSIFNKDAKPVLGYTLLAKQKFNIVTRDWYVSLINPLVEKHHTPVVLYKDAQVFLRKFNNPEDPSYWMILRHRTT